MEKETTTNKAVESVSNVFSLQRDLNSNNPYHLDGDEEMYTEQNLLLREELSKDPEIKKELEKILSFYKANSDGTIPCEEYKNIQKCIAIILRPDIDK